MRYVFLLFLSRPKRGELVAGLHAGDEGVALVTAVVLVGVVERHAHALVLVPLVAHVAALDGVLRLLLPLPVPLPLLFPLQVQVQEPQQVPLVPKPLPLALPFPLQVLLAWKEAPLALPEPHATFLGRAGLQLGAACS